MTSNVIVQSQPGLSDLAFPIEFAATVGRIMTSAEREAELCRVRPEFDMLTVLSSEDGSRLAIEIQMLMSMNWELDRLLQVKQAMRAPRENPREFLRRMESKWRRRSDLEEIRSELRWRCDHSAGFRHGHCKCCEMNELFTTDAQKHARKLVRDGIRKSHWRSLTRCWDEIKRYVETWDK